MNTTWNLSPKQHFATSDKRALRTNRNDSGSHNILNQANSLLPIRPKKKVTNPNVSDKVCYQLYSNQQKSINSLSKGSHESSYKMQPGLMIFEDTAVYIPNQKWAWFCKIFHDLLIDTSCWFQALSNQTVPILEYYLLDSPFEKLISCFKQ